MMGIILLQLLSPTIIVKIRIKQWEEEIHGE
jgi:hypothetical protein